MIVLEAQRLYHSDPMDMAESVAETVCERGDLVSLQGTISQGFDPRSNASLVHIACRYSIL